MAFIEQNDILDTFEDLIKHFLKSLKIDFLEAFPRISYQDAMERFGSEKPDLRFEMEWVDFTLMAQEKDFRFLMTLNQYL